MILNVLDLVYLLVEVASYDNLSIWMIPLDPIGHLDQFLLTVLLDIWLRIVSNDYEVRLQIIDLQFDKGCQYVLVVVLLVNGSEMSDDP